MLARIGALNHLNDATELHRRDALWQIEKAARKAGPLLENVVEADTASPLYRMEVEERLVADYHGTGMTVGPHPMAYQRSACAAWEFFPPRSCERRRTGNRRWWRDA